VSDGELGKVSLTFGNVVTQRWRGWASYGVLADFLWTGPS